MKIYKWTVAFDLARALSNANQSGIELNDTEIEMAFHDLAKVMDTMMVKRCSFPKAVKIKRKSDPGFGTWIEDALEHIVEQLSKTASVSLIAN